MVRRWLQGINVFQRQARRVPRPVVASLVVGLLSLVWVFETQAQAGAHASRPLYRWKQIEPPPQDQQPQVSTDQPGPRATLTDHDSYSVHYGDRLPSDRGVHAYDREQLNHSAISIHRFDEQGPTAEEQQAERRRLADIRAIEQYNRALLDTYQTAAELHAYHATVQDALMDRLALMDRMLDRMARQINSARTTDTVYPRLLTTRANQQKARDRLQQQLDDLLDSHAREAAHYAQLIESDT